MEKSVRIDGIDYPLFVFSNDGFHWNPRYHITSCLLGHVAGRRRIDGGDGFFDVGVWKFIQPVPPEKKAKENKWRYRPYNDQELERLSDDGVILVNKNLNNYKAKVVANMNCYVYLVGGWVSGRELLDGWEHRDGSKCGVEVFDDEK